MVSAVFWTRDVETALAAEKEMAGQVGKVAQSTVDELMKIIDLVRCRWIYP